MISRFERRKIFSITKPGSIFNAEKGSNLEAEQQYRPPERKN
jgi:hypothetical protein